MIKSNYIQRLFALICIITCGFFSVAHADEKPKAADLVEDGQLIDLSSPRYEGLFKELKLDYGFNQQELDKCFSGVTILKRVLELMDTQWESRPYFEYYPILVNDEMITKGRKILRRYKRTLDKIEQRYKVERRIIIAIWGIETKFGESGGEYNTFRTLNTLFDAYPRRRNFFRKQLIHFLLLCKENKIDPLSINGSYAGAIGQTQFIPSSFREYAVDFDRNGRRDVWNSVPDILASIANYLHRYHWEFGAPIYRELGDELKDQTLLVAYRNGRRWFFPWQKIKTVQGVEMPSGSSDKKIAIIGLEMPEGATRFVAGYPNFYAITKWNNSSKYAMAVVELAEKLNEK